MSSKQTLENVQVLRGLAAAMVVVQHSVDQFSNHPIAAMARLRDPFHGALGIGVDVFFIVSGFIMYHIAKDDFGVPGRAKLFLYRRLARVAPLYWLLTIPIGIISLVAPRLVNHEMSGAAHLISSLLFWPWLNNEGLVHPVLGLGWTLNYEVAFYVAFAAALLLPNRVGIWALVGFLIALAAAHPILPTVQLGFWSDPVILEFLAGIGLAWLRPRVQLPTAGAAALFGTGVVLMFAATALHGVHRVVFGGVPALFLTSALMLSRERKWWGGLLFIGNASYSLYLIHPYGLNVMTMVWIKLHLPNVAPLYLVSLVVFALSAGGVCYLGAEKPIERRMKQLLGAAQRRPATAVQEGLRDAVTRA
jgi:peptidoglycan/LPS O-acetylase OafA/YrhL